MTSSGDTDIREAADKEISKEEGRKLAGGFIRFYGLYWDRDVVDWENNRLLAIPQGRVGQGKRPKEADDTWNCMNFWGQKGVYVLYDSNLIPVYAGQAGTQRKNSTGGNDLGGRLRYHYIGKYRNGWKYFSWFGFLGCRLENLREVEEDQRFDPKWDEIESHKTDINALLSSFEAILIEGFIPRLNARGGDLKDAVRCDQYLPKNDSKNQRDTTK